MTDHRTLLSSIIESIIKDRGTKQDVTKCTDQALRVTKSFHFARVNQFEVDSQLKGLVEKFSVLNREDLSVPLEKLLSRLSQLSSKDTPDILALLLHLSDKPVTKSAPHELEKYSSFISDQQPLTWSQVLADDPLSDEDLWRNDFSSISSDELDHIDSQESQASFSENDETSHLFKPQNIEKFHVQPDRTLLDELHQLQFWSFQRAPGTLIHKIHVSDINLLREIISALRRLPTSLFDVSETSVVTYNSTYSNLGLPSDLIQSILDEIAFIATSLRHLNDCCQTATSDITLQRLQASACNKLHSLTLQLNEIETQYTNNPEEKIISIIDIISKLKSITRPLLELNVVISKIINQVSNPFVHLEMLYDISCMHQSIGDDQLYNYFSDIFLDCLDMYLTSVQQWMQNGSLSSNDLSFFIIRHHLESPHQSLWHDEYSLRATSSGKLLAPKFIHSNSKRIFNAGKSVVFLQRLGIRPPELSIESTISKKKSIKTLLEEKPQNSLIQFGSVLDSVLQEWIKSQCTTANELLRMEIMSTHRLHENLHALQQIYFGSNSIFFQTVIDSVFEALDSRSPSWNDRFAILEKVRDYFLNSTVVDSHRISVRTEAPKSNARSIHSLSSIYIDYNLSWPLLNVIRKESLSVYQKVFRYLIQIQRVNFVLKKLVLMRNNVTPFKSIEMKLKQELYYFTDILQSHLVNAIIKPSIQELHNKIEGSLDIDELTEAHDSVLRSIQSQCLLTKNLGPIHHSIICMLEIGVQFADSRQQNINQQNLDNSKKLEYRRRNRRKSEKIVQVEWSSSEDETGDGKVNYDADTEKVSGMEGTYEEKLRKMKDEVTRLRKFIITGLRGISRTGGEFSWEMLADQLDWDKST